MWITISILSAIILIFGYIIYISILKLETLESAYTSQQRFIGDLREVIETSAEKLAEIDVRGSFSSDDEIGWFFDSVKGIQEELNTFSKP